MLSLPEFLPFGRPSISQKDIDSVVSVLSSNWIGTGPVTKGFELQLAQYLDTDSPALALNSATSGLFIALKLAGINHTHSVVLPSFTFTATANVVEHIGASCRFVPSHFPQFHPTLEDIIATCHESTKAIIVVHYAGFPVPYLKQLSEFCKSRSIHLIEDCAHALGSSLNGVKVGAYGNLSSYSFYATKNITSVEGGALIVPPQYDISRADSLRLHGMSREAWSRFNKGSSLFYDVLEPGYKYNMTDVTASLAASQLDQLDHFMELRDAICEIYFERLSHSNLILPHHMRNHSRASHYTSWHLFPILLPSSLAHLRDNYVRLLNERNIGAVVHYLSLLEFSYYKNKYASQVSSDSSTCQLSSSVFSLPVNSSISEETAHLICDICQEINSILFP